MSKAIYFAGVSRLNGELKFRTAQSPARFQQLTKLGDTEVEMTSVSADSKEQAAQELLDRNFANGRAEILALLEAVAGKEVKTTRAPKPRTVKAKVKKAKVNSAPKFDFDAKMKPSEAEKIRAEFMAKLKTAYEAS